MKIAFFSSHINKSHQWLWFQEELKNYDLEQIHIFIEEKEPILKKDLEDIGVKTYFLKHSSSQSHFKNLFLAHRILKDFKPDIVHTTLPYGNIIGLFAAKFSGVKNRITTCENASWAHDFNSKNHSRIDKITFALSKKIVSASNSAYEYLVEKWSIDESRIELIYHGLKPSEYNSISQERVLKVKKEFDIAEEDFIIGMVSRLEFWKGHEYAIMAMENLVKKHPKLKLLIFGSSGPDHEKIISMIDDLGLSDNVRYCGFYNDPVALYQVFNIHLHIPINKYVETHGITIIEGMISGCPQVLTKSGYAFQSAKNEVNCLVANFKDSESVFMQIERLILNEDLRNRISKKAQEDAISTYSVMQKAKLHFELYTNMLK